MMFASVAETVLESSATRLVTDYGDHLERKASALAKRGTLLTGAHLAEQSAPVAKFAARAAEIIAADAFATLPADLQDDVKAIAEESDAAVSEFAAASDPDAVWATLDADQKARIIAKLPIPEGVRDQLHARVSGKLRKK